ncbi:MAG: zinc-ribbon domain-containing protein [Bacilli bacterium]|nr:zinc-ribbon domain-containing protein [Bacilli bacterium]
METCSKCGKKLKKGDLFCGECGTKVGKKVAKKKEEVSKKETKKSNEGLVVASLVIGIIAIIFSAVLNILIVPLAILGLIFGIVGKSSKGKGKKIAGIILNSLALFIAIVVFTIIVVFIVSVVNDSDNVFNNAYKDIVSTADEDSIHETWYCKTSSNGVITSTDYTLTLKFEENGKFDWKSYKYPSKNYVYGKYSFIKPYKLDSNKKRYYVIDLKPEVMYLYGIKRTTQSSTKYNVYFTEDEHIKLVNQKTNNIYYCDEK